jgi:septum formation protein
MRPLILASQSSWRKTILEKLGIPFDVVVSNFEEDMTQKLPPNELALALANGKARTVALMHPDALIIAADTFIIFGDELMGKPGTPDRAIEMLTKLSGKWHEIITGFVIIDGQTGQIHEEVVYTRVHLRDAGKEEIEDYVATGEPLNVAGGYAIQGRAGALIDRIEGDYWNIAGLPMSALTVALKKFGITPQ